MHKRWIRLLPILMVTFIISFMDRTNISFAIPTMGKELALTSTVLGFASGVLFIGYGVSQTFGGGIADRGQGRLLISVLLVLWGLVELAQAFVTDATQLVIARFFLGAFEGGIFPTFLLMVKNWFGPNERARANGIWQLCYPIASLISGPIAGVILTWGTWRELFIIEGIVPIVWALVWYWGAADAPESASWLTDQDRRELQQHLAKQVPIENEEATGEATFGAQMARTPVILFSIVITLWNLGFLGFTIWLPSVVAQGKDLTPNEIGWLSAAPFGVAIVAMQCLTYLSDRFRDRRRIATASVTICGLALLVGGLTFETNSFLINVLLLVVAGALLYGTQPVLWSMPADFLPGKIAGTIMGTINGISSIGSFLGPYIVGYARSWTGSFSSGLWMMGLCVLIAALLVFNVKVSAKPAAVPREAAA